MVLSNFIVTLQTIDDRVDKGEERFMMRMTTVFARRSKQSQPVRLFLCRWFPGACCCILFTVTAISFDAFGRGGLDTGDLGLTIAVGRRLFWHDLLLEAFGPTRALGLRCCSGCQATGRTLLLGPGRAIGIVGALVFVVCVNQCGPSPVNVCLRRTLSFLELGFGR